MLAHNAVTARVPVDLGRLFDEPAGGLYAVALGAVTDLAHESKDRQQREFEAKTKAAGL